MIGSGFSRNADKPRTEVNDLPLWNDIATEIAKSLYPDVKVPTIDNPLRLAQQYKTLFGRSDLHNLLGRLVKDRSFLPGETHRRLLKLPWRDVFTTNWDTLLERTSWDIAEHSYSVVEDMDQLPLVSQPRIIKLHGSLPSKFPLIITEEDYRTYPTNYAPFVNTVQQAMMESIFCLIGFSGDDPNFIQWSNWLRDNLGEAAPKIYLAGLLKLLPHERRTLEDRGVVPIDLWNHPNAHAWPEHLQHQFAVQWILHSIEFGEPYDENIWPSTPDSSQIDIDPRLEPIVRVPFDVPKGQPPRLSRSDMSTYSEEERESIREVVEAWKHNRGLYPGWLVFPSGVEHFQLSSSTDEWEPHILNALTWLTAAQRISAVREILWRREILLEPITPNLANAAQEVLDTFDCEQRVIRGSGEVIEDWSEVREAWRNIALFLVMDARYDCDQVLFERRLTELETFQSDSPDVGHRIHQERCLWALYSSNFQGLNELLDDWNIENSDPIWKLRKAALLTEMRRHNESFPLIQDALNSIRKDLAGDRTIANASRLGWALGSTLTGSNRRSVFRRWDQLASEKSHAWYEIDHLIGALTGIDERKDAPQFDLGLRSRSTFRWTNERNARLVAAYRALRLPEVTGLPPFNFESSNHVPPMTASANILALAAEELAPYSPELAIRIVLRIGQSDRDKTLLRVVSRTRIAGLSDHATDRIARISTQVVEHVLPRLFAADESSVGLPLLQRMGVALEILSRLVLRVNPELATDALELGLRCYRTKGIAENHWLANPIGNLVERSWVALPKNVRTEWVFEVLYAPIAGLDGFGAMVECGDPGSHVVQEDLLGVGSVEYTPRFEEVVNFLLRALRSANVNARNSAVIRLMPIVFSGNLSQEQALEIASALWGETDPILSNSNGPNSPFDWVFMLLPEMSPGQAEQSFRQKWLTPRPITEDKVSGFAQEMLSQLGPAIGNRNARERLLPLTDEENEYVSTLLLQFVKNIFGDSVTIGTHTSIRHLNTVAEAIVIPNPIAEEMFNVIEGMLGTGTVHYRDPIRLLGDFLYNVRIAISYTLIPGLVKTLPDRVSTMAMWLSAGLASGEEIRINNALVATRTWALASQEEFGGTAPDSLVREVGAIIASRRKDALSGALVCATVIFDRGTLSHKVAISTFALHGLSFLAEETQYVRYLEDDDVPTVRLLCVQLASHMVTSGLGDNPIVAEWLDIGRNDPFPEVRNVALAAEVEGPSHES